MLKKRNKAISIAVALVFCFTFIAPALIAPPAAQAAAVEYSFSGPGEIKTSEQAQNIGQIVVSISEVRLLPVYNGKDGEYLSVSLPVGMSFDIANIGRMGPKVDAIFDGGTKTRLAGDPSYPANISSDGRTLNLKIASISGQSGTEKILIKLSDVIVKDASGDISVLVGGPAGGVFPQAPVTLGKTVTKGSTTSVVKSVKTFGDSGGKIDDIIIMENMKDVFEAKEVITLKLTNGFAWKGTITAKFDWGLAGTQVATPTFSGRDLTITLPESLPARTTAARLVISGAEINVEDTGRTGDVSVNVKSNKNVTETDLVVAKYGDYGAKVVEDTVKDLVAGQNEQKIGSFYIEENIPGSLVEGRALNLDLPAGVKWINPPKVSVKKGSDRLGTPNPVTGSKGRSIKYAVTAKTNDACKLLLEDGKVYVEPGFSGPIEVKVSGTAGVEGTVKVAEVKPAVTLKAEGVKDIVIGSQNQKVADILIVENAKEAILKDNNHDQIVLALDSGYKFYKKPVVAVSEGDLEIDTVKLNSDNNELTIKIKYSSTKASTIKLSDVYLTGFRSAPEGPVKAILKEAEGTVAGSTVTGSTSLDEGYKYFQDEKDQRFSETSAGNVVIANCVTPAEAGASISFKIDSNIYTVNGIAKVMDVAPYIKDNRTYVPMRYMSEALGAQVVWDNDARTVTLTKGDVVAVFTIGSTTYTVNGENKTADVAPEISKDRTMLPARYVAEACGAVVGWDASTRTVIINQ